MAAKLFLTLVGLVGVMWYLAWYRRADRGRRNRSLISILLYGTAAALLILVLTGRISWLFALFSAAAPWINRVLTAKRIWHQFNQSHHTNTNRSENRASTPAKMTREQAHKILNLHTGASKQDIIDAHRRLMQKIHPDRGGSDFLATQINQAKETLLNSQT